MATKKSRSKYEYERQISIAQVGIDELRNESEIEKGSRAEEIIKNHQSSVKLWASKYEI